MSVDTVVGNGGECMPGFFEADYLAHGSEVVLSAGFVVYTCWSVD